MENNFHLQLRYGLEHYNPNDPSSESQERGEQLIHLINDHIEELDAGDYQVLDKFRIKHYGSSARERPARMAGGADDPVVKRVNQVMGLHILGQARGVEAQLGARIAAELGATDFTEENADLKGAGIDWALEVMAHAVGHPDDRNWEELSDAARTLALLDFAELDSEVVDTVYAYVSDILGTMEGEASEAARDLQNVGVMLQRAVDANRLPEELQNQPAFHGRAIASASNQVLDFIRNGGREVAFSLQHFVRSYTATVLTQGGTQRFLIRPCSSIHTQEIDGHRCEFFVVSTSEEPHRNRQRQGGQAPTPEIKHALVARHEGAGEDGSDVWRIAVTRGGGVRLRGTRYTSLKNLIAATYRGYKPIGQLEERAIERMANSYFTEELFDSSDSITLNRSAESRIDPILNELNDPIDLSPVQLDPMLSPSGHTFNGAQIRRQVRTNGQDPLTRRRLRESELRPNMLVLQIATARADELADRNHHRITDLEDFREDAILRLFEDPLSPGTMMADPVHAPDGEVYDRTTLMDYLQSHGNQLPNDGGKCKQGDLIPDIVARNVLAARIQQIRDGWPK